MKGLIRSNSGFSAVLIDTYFSYGKGYLYTYLVGWLVLILWSLTLIHYWPSIPYWRRSYALRRRGYRVGLGIYYFNWSYLLLGTLLVGILFLGIPYGVTYLFFVPIISWVTFTLWSVTLVLKLIFVILSLMSMHITHCPPPLKKFFRWRRGLKWLAPISF